MLRAPKYTYSALALALALSSVSQTAYAQNADRSTWTKSEIGEIVHEYLVDNPEVLIEATEALKKRQAEAQRATAADALERFREMIERSPDSPVGGNPEASLTVVEFFDYNCPYCERQAPEIKTLLKERDDVRFVYKEWPILKESSLDAAKIGLAVNRIGGQAAYEAFHHKLYELGSVTDEKLSWAIAHAELNEQQVRKMAEQKWVADELEQTAALAKALGISGTPAFVIGDEVLSGLRPAEALEEIIDK